MERQGRKKLSHTGDQLRSDIKMYMVKDGEKMIIF